MRRICDIVTEPRGVLFERLIRALAARATSVMMVLRDDYGLSEKGELVLSRLAPFLIESSRRSAWPGTELLVGEATVLTFRMNDSVVSQIVLSADGLYEWQQPNLPEDLAFFRDDGSVLLATISHENDAYLEVDEVEYRDLIRAVSGLSGLTKWSELKSIDPSS